MAKIKNYKILDTEKYGVVRRNTEDNWKIRALFCVHKKIMFFHYPCTKCISGDIVYVITEILFEKVKYGL